MSGPDPVAALQACLDRIAARNPAINAFLELDEDGALRAALAASERWGQGRQLSSIDGMPIGVKANIAVAGMAWHAGIGAYRDRIAKQDAACVAALRKAGGVVLGTLNMDAAALGASTDNAVFGRTENPWRPGYSTGGSSGGAAAAVASGFCVAALGTDTLGSVRIPASYCGVVGAKPRHGAIALEGVVALAPTFDTLGVLAADVDNARQVMAVLRADSDVVRPVRTLGVLAVPDAAVAPAVSAAMRAAAAAAQLQGLRVTPVALPCLDLRALRQACVLVTALAARGEHGDAMAQDPDEFCARLRGLLAWATAYEARHGPASRILVRQAADVLRSCLARHDAVLMPTTPGPAFAFSDGAAQDQADFTLLANVSGLAAVAFPVGLDAAGLPLSLQAVSPSLGACLAVADALTCLRQAVLF